MRYLASLSLVSSGRTGFLQRLAVDRVYQRTGIGRSLVADALQWSKRWFVNELLVNTQIGNTGAQKSFMNPWGSAKVMDLRIEMEREFMKFHRLLISLLLTLGVSMAAGTSAAANQESAGGLQVVNQSLVTHNDEVFDLVLQLPGVVSNGDQITVTVHERVTSEEQFLASSRGANLGRACVTASTWQICGPMFGASPTFHSLFPTPKSVTSS